MIKFLEKLKVLGRKDMVLQVEGNLARAEIVKFLVNCEVKEGRVTSKFRGVKISFDDKQLGDIPNILIVWYNGYTTLKLPFLDDLPTSQKITRKLDYE